ncbi:MAG TPA: hypothetical protein VN737_02865 [Bryobacteraceae bacterium]|nr:hypothetical protein [Bryobacteraceae bacterium]
MKANVVFERLWWIHPNSAESGMNGLITQFDSVGASADRTMRTVAFPWRTKSSPITASSGGAG